MVEYLSSFGEVILLSAKGAAQLELARHDGTVDGELFFAGLGGEAIEIRTNVTDLVAGRDDSPTATGWLSNQPGIHFFNIMPDDDVLSLNDELRKLGSIIYCSGTILEVTINRHCAACFHHQRTTTWQRTVDGGIAVDGAYIMARKAPHIDRRTSRRTPTKARHFHIARWCPAASWRGGVGKGKAILRAVIITTIPPPAR